MAESDLSQIRKDIGRLVARFDHDYMSRTDETGQLKERLQVYKRNLGIQN